MCYLCLGVIVSPTSWHQTDQFCRADVDHLARATTLRHSPGVGGPCVTTSGGMSRFDRLRDADSSALLATSRLLPPFDRGNSALQTLAQRCGYLAHLARLKCWSTDGMEHIGLVEIDHLVADVARPAKVIVPLVLSSALAVGCFNSASSDNVDGTSGSGLGTGTDAGTNAGTNAGTGTDAPPQNPRATLRHGPARSRSRRRHREDRCRPRPRGPVPRRPRQPSNHLPPSARLRASLMLAHDRDQSFVDEATILDACDELDLMRPQQDSDQTSRAPPRKSRK